MSDNAGKLTSTRLSPAKIVTIYGIAGVVWILTTGIWALEKARASKDIFLIETGKGLFFVAATATLLWFLCRSWSKQMGRAVKRYEASQDRYRIYIQNSPVSINVVDPDGTIRETNRATRELTGHETEKLPGMNVFDLIPAEDVVEIKPIFEQVLSEGRASRDCRIRRKDGNIRYARIDGVKHSEDSVLLFSRDITDRRESEEKLLMLNAMLRAIRRVSQAIVHESKVSDLIRSICEILVEEREFRHAWIALLDSEGKPQHYCNAPLPDHDGLRRFLEEGRLPATMEKIRRADGLIVALDPAKECPDFPIMEGLEDSALIAMEFSCDDRRGFIGLMAERTAAEDEEELGLFREVAEDLAFALHSIKVEEEKTRAIGDLVKAKREAEKANRAKDEFLAVMSHEMRTPLNPIMGHCSLLREEIRNPDQLQALEQIQASSEHLLKLIDDILFFADIERTPHRVDSGRFNLLELCVDRFDRQKANTTSACDLQLVNGAGEYSPVDSGTFVKADGDMLRRILDELLSNACKYTHHGEVLLRIGIKPITDGPHELLIEVEDSGIGISEDALETLFNPFTQADSSHTRRYEGIGLGLAICHRIATALNGSLRARSRPGEGSCFTFTCPVELENSPDGPKKETIPPTAESPATKTVLVVEDNPSNAKVAEVILKRMGYTVDIAEDGEAAVKQSKTNRYDCILMDLSMPVMNGFDATKAILDSGSPNRNTPIIGLTAHVSADVKSQCLRSGMKGFVPKPIRLESLKSTLQKAV
ncbi:MAG: ATP-binding protein [Verrucomicrobiota bacterium]